MQAHRQAERARCVRLAKSGPGWHAYALHEAAQLEKRDPALHDGLLAVVEAEIGPAAVKAARAAAKWMGVKP